MSHKTKQSALQAARKALGPTAIEGVDFSLRNTGAGWEHESIPAANEAAVKAKAKKAASSALEKGRAMHQAILEGGLPPGIAAAGLAEAMGGPLATEAVAADRARAAVPKKAKATPKPKADKAKPTVPKPKPPAGKTKHAMLLEMLARPGGATSKELETAAGWVSHSVRGFIGTLKKNGTPVLSKKLKGEPTYYSIRKAAAPKADPTPVEVIGDVV